MYQTSHNLLLEVVGLFTFVYPDTILLNCAHNDSCIHDLLNDMALLGDDVVGKLHVLCATKPTVNTIKTRS